MMGDTYLSTVITATKDGSAANLPTAFKAKTENVAAILAGPAQINPAPFNRLKQLAVVGETLLWAPGRKLRRLLAPLSPILRSTIRAFTSGNGSHGAFVQNKRVIHMCNLGLLATGAVLHSIHVVAPQQPAKVFISDTGSKIMVIGENGGVFLGDVASKEWVPIPQCYTTAMCVNWCSSHTAVYSVTHTTSKPLCLTIHIIPNDNTQAITTRHWGLPLAAQKSGFGLMVETECDVQELHNEISRRGFNHQDFHLAFCMEANTLAILARPGLRMPVVLVHLAPRPASYSLSLQTSLQRRLLADPAHATALDAFHSGPSGMTWFPSGSSHVLALSTRTGDCVCVSTTAEVLAPTFDVPAVSPASRMNVTIPDLPYTWNTRSRSTLATTQSPCYFLLASGCDRNGSACLLVSDGIYGATFKAPAVVPISLYIESSPADGRRMSLPAQRRLSRRMSCVQKNDVNASMTVIQLYAHLDHLLQPCHADKTSTSLTRVTSAVLRPLISEAKYSKNPHALGLAIHAILHVERWLALCLGGACQWAGGWNLLATLQDDYSSNNQVFNAICEVAQIKFAASVPFQEPFPGIDPICRFLQGEQATSAFKSTRIQFIGLLNSNLREAAAFVNTFICDIKQRQKAERIVTMWIDVGVGIIASRACEWQMPVDVPTVFDDNRKIELNLNDVRELDCAGSFPDFTENGLLEFATRARLAEYALNKATTWDDAWPNRILLACSLLKHSSALALATTDVRNCWAHLEGMMKSFIASEDEQKMFFAAGAIASAGLAVDVGPIFDSLLALLKREIKMWISAVPFAGERFPRMPSFLFEGKCVLAPRYSVIAIEGEKHVLNIMRPWLLSAILISTSQKKHRDKVLRVVYALELRARMMSAEPGTMDHTECAVAMLQFDDIFELEGLVSLGTTVLRKFGASDALELLGACAPETCAAIKHRVVTGGGSPNFNIGSDMNPMGVGFGFGSSSCWSAGASAGVSPYRKIASDSSSPGGSKKKIGFSANDPKYDSFLRRFEESFWRYMEQHFTVGRNDLYSVLNGNMAPNAPPLMNRTSWELLFGRPNGSPQSSTIPRQNNSTALPFAQEPKTVPLLLELCIPQETKPAITTAPLPARSVELCCTGVSTDFESNVACMDKNIQTDNLEFVCASESCHELPSKQNHNVTASLPREKSCSTLDTRGREHEKEIICEIQKSKEKLVERPRKKKKVVFVPFDDRITANLEHIRKVLSSMPQEVRPVRQTQHHLKELDVDAGSFKIDLEKITQSLGSATIFKVREPRDFEHSAELLALAKSLEGIAKGIKEINSAPSQACPGLSQRARKSKNRCNAPKAYRLCEKQDSPQPKERCHINCQSPILLRQEKLPRESSFEDFKIDWRKAYAENQQVVRRHADNLTRERNAYLEIDSRLQALQEQNINTFFLHAIPPSRWL